MNRRNFLRSGSLAAFAAAGLPAAVKAMGKYDDGTPITYRTVPETGTKGQRVFEIMVFHNAIDNFKTATDAEKIITIKGAYFASTDFTRPDTQGEFRYKIKSVEANKEKPGEYIITTKFDKKVSGNFSFGSDYPKNPKLNIKEYEYVEILSKEGYILNTVPYPTTSTGTTTGAGCFLTTACVTHRQLADDCVELQQLRSLRDNFMLSSREGDSLVKQYYAVGPSIVQAIDSCSNKAIIYEYMYQHMILPSVALVQQGRHEEAVGYYKTFVKALAEKYQ